MRTRKDRLKSYFTEAFGLFVFMVCAGLATTLLEYPGSFVHQQIPQDWLRRVVLGAFMAIVVFLIVSHPWGKKSGAHINPAITWAFWRAGNISTFDAVGYTICQFIGGIAAAAFNLLVIGEPFTSNRVKFSTTQPGDAGPLAAFVGEFVITAFLMLVVLTLSHSRRFKDKLNYVIAALIGLYLVVEEPLSGMSLNPARSFGSALIANQWNGIWIYFTAPPLAAWFTASFFRRHKKSFFNTEKPVFPKGAA